MNLDRLRSKLGYQGALLASVALLTSAALAVAARITGPEIAAAEARDLQQSLSQVAPGEYDNDWLQDTLSMPGPEDDITVYRGRRAGKVEAVVFQVIGNGYAGPIVCMMGVDKTGRLLGVRVIKHTETPGLGDKIDPAKSGWIHAFKSRFLGNPAVEQFAVKKDGGIFDQFAGATITPRAVVKAVKGGLIFFDREKTRLLDEVAAPAVQATAPNSAKASL